MLTRRSAGFEARLATGNLPWPSLTLGSLGTTPSPVSAFNAAQQHKQCDHTQNRNLCQSFCHLPAQRLSVLTDRRQPDCGGCGQQSQHTRVRSGKIPQELLFSSDQDHQRHHAYTDQRGVRRSGRRFQRDHCACGGSWTFARPLTSTIYDLRSYPPNRPIVLPYLVRRATFSASEASIAAASSPSSITTQGTGSAVPSSASATRA